MAKSFRVTLVSPNSHLWDPGLRLISSCLVQAGWQTDLIFLPDVNELLTAPYPHVQTYPDTVVRQVCELCTGADLVGITVSSNFFGRARTLTEALHSRLSARVIWGGIHATVKPEECLAWADYVCLGEGEDAIVELVGALATGQDLAGIANIGLKGPSGAIVLNPVRPLLQRLDELPLPDYDLSHQYVLHKGRVTALTRELLAGYMLYLMNGVQQVVYVACLTRGCPSTCTYCCASALVRVYPGWCRVRRHSPEHLAAEIGAARRVIPDLQAVAFYDDSFLTGTTEEIAHFSRVYRAQVGLPFSILVSPTTVQRTKLQYLIDAGLCDVEMGIQTASTRGRATFRRREDDARVLAAAQDLHSFEWRLKHPRYDIIADNPYESDTDRLDTLRLLYRLPRPYRLYLYSLTLYPGSDLYRRAKVDGLLGDDDSEIYRKNYNLLAPTYLNFVLWCMHRNLPRWSLWLMIRPLAARVSCVFPCNHLIKATWKILNRVRVEQARRRYRLRTEGV